MQPWHHHIHDVPRHLVQSVERPILDIPQKLQAPFPEQCGEFKQSRRICSADGADVFLANRQAQDEVVLEIVVLDIEDLGWNDVLASQQRGHRSKNLARGGPERHAVIEMALDGGTSDHQQATRECLWYRQILRQGGQRLGTMQILEGRWQHWNMLRRAGGAARLRVHDWLLGGELSRAIAKVRLDVWSQCVVGLYGNPLTKVFVARARRKRVIFAELSAGILRKNALQHPQLRFPGIARGGDKRSPGRGTRDQHAQMNQQIHRDLPPARHVCFFPVDVADEGRLELLADG